MKLAFLLRCLALLLIFELTMVGCYFCGSEDRKFQVLNYDIKPVKGVFEFGTTRFPYHSEGTMLVDGDSVLIHLLGFRLLSENLYFSSLHQQNFGSIANACDPAPPLPTQKFVSINITSNHDFHIDGKHYKTGSSLNDMFYHTQFGSVTEYLATNPEVPYEDFMLLIKGSIDTAQTHSFTFHILLDDGSEFSILSPALTLLP
jgi:hypothetical protein